MFDNFLAFAADKLSGWDFLVACLIVCLVEFLVKPLMQKAPSTVYDIVVRFLPILLGIVFYMVSFFVAKNGEWYTYLLHGVLVGFTSMGSYQAILKSIKEGVKDIADTLKCTSDEGD